MLKFFPCCRYFSDLSRRPTLPSMSCSRYLTVFSGLKEREQDNGEPWMSPEKLLDFRGKTRARVSPFPPVVLSIRSSLGVRRFFLPPLSFVLSPFLLEKAFSSLSPSRDLRLLHSSSRTRGSSPWKQRRQGRTQEFWVWSVLKFKK